MSIATGLNPAALLELDGPMFDALELEGGRRWTVRDELAALTLEAIDRQHVAFLAVHARKGARVRDPITVPRPGADGYPTPPRLSAAAFAAAYGPRSGDG